ncbi:MAG: helix-turn-helix domain-containing protein [Capsulimonadaceae bacterium]
MIATPAFGPTAEDSMIARESSAALAPLLLGNTGSLPHIRIRTSNNTEADIPLPSSVLGVLLDALEEMAKGNAVIVSPQQAELTTQQAADMMRISRPSLIKMLDEGKLPYRKVGAHRRIRRDDVVRTIAVEHARRVSVMEELVAETERLGLYQ